MSKTATMKTAISPARLPKTEPSANSIDFVDEDLALVPVSGIPEEFRKLSRFLPVIVLVPKSAVHDKTRSEEHTSELQSRLHLVCRLLLEKKKKSSIHV